MFYFTRMYVCFALIVMMSAVSGCGTLSNGGKQTIFVQTVAGNKIVDANCNLKNNAGEWQVASSNDVVINKSAGKLVIECLTKDKEYAGIETVSSETNSSMWASIITVGVVATVDAASASGFDYPRNMVVVMKKILHEETPH